jgi:uncharacterized protein YqeY
LQGRYIGEAVVAVNRAGRGTDIYIRYLEISAEMPLSHRFTGRIPMRDKITDALKTALKSGDRERSGTLRLVNAAIQDRDIANRGTGKGAASDDEVMQILAKMVKQREESAKAFDDGNRPELAAKERSEIEIIRGFLPTQMDDAATEQAIRDVIAQTGAAGVRDMGRVMAALREKYVGQMDFGKASGVVKSLLQ